MILLNQTLGLGRPFKPNSFDFPSSSYLSISDANWGAYDRDTFAISVWFKKSSAGDIIDIFNKGGENSSETNGEFRLYATISGVGWEVNQNATDGTGLFVSWSPVNNTDWHHLLAHYDGNNATATDRLKLWIDGTLVTVFDFYSMPSAGSAQTTTSSVYIRTVLSFGTPAPPAYQSYIFQPTFFSGSLPAIGDVYSSTVFKNLSGLAGAYSLLAGRSSVVEDTILTPDWTNTGSVTLSTTRPV